MIALLSLGRRCRMLASASGCGPERPIGRHRIARHGPLLEALEPRQLLSATQLVISLQPVNGYVGSFNAFPLEVELQDALGVIDITDNSKVKVAIASGPGKLLGKTTVNAVAGVAQFNQLKFSVPGTYTLVVTDGALTADTSNPITINAAPVATTLVFTQQPTGNPVGAAITTPIQVTVLDQYGNPNSAPKTVQLKLVSGPPGSHLKGKLNIKIDAGVATFNQVSVDAGGTFVLMAKLGALTVNSDPFDMGGPPVATSLQFVQQPTTVGAGVIMTPAPTVQVLDQYGNVLTTDRSTVKLTVASGPASSKTFSATVKSGVATFSKLSFVTMGTYTLQATDKSLAAVTSDSFEVTAGPAHHLAFLQMPPSGSLASDPQTVVVQVVDRFGNLVITDTSTVTLSYAKAPAAATPLALSVQASAGVATFTGITFGTAGKYTLLATDDPLVSLKSSTILLV